MKRLDVRYCEKSKLYFIGGGILPISCLEVGQTWVGSSGSTVKIDSIENNSDNDPWVTYSWQSNGETYHHTKNNWGFQSRYCLVVDEVDMQNEKLNQIVDFSIFLIR